MSKSTNADTRSYNCPYPACKEVCVNQTHMLFHIKHWHTKQKLDATETTVLIDAVGASQSQGDKELYFCPCGAGPFTVHPRSAKIHLSKLEDDETVIWHKFLAADLQGREIDRSKIDRDEFYVYHANAGVHGYFVPTKTDNTGAASESVDLTNEWKFMTYQPLAAGDIYIDTPTDDTSPTNTVPATTRSILQPWPNIDQSRFLLTAQALDDETKEFEKIMGGTGVDDFEAQSQGDYFWLVENVDLDWNTTGDWDADDPMNPDNVMKNLPPVDMDWKL